MTWLGLLLYFGSLLLIFYGNWKFYTDVVGVRPDAWRTTKLFGVSVLESIVVLTIEKLAGWM